MGLLPGLARIALPAIQRQHCGFLLEIGMHPITVEAPLSSRLTAFERFPLLEGDTPIQGLHRLSSNLKGVRLYVKRDDLLGVGGGGNKLRKLEFLIGDALTKSCDTLISFGGRQSNHARLSAAAAARAGMRCELILTPSAARSDDDFMMNGNVLLDEILGANIHFLPHGIDPIAYADELAVTLTKQGRRPYLTPLAGSSPVGCLGYANAAAEIQRQSITMGLQFAQVVLPNGSGGSQAGLIAGYQAMGLDPRVIKSYTVLSEYSSALEITTAKTRETLALLSPASILDEGAVLIDGQHLGDGYGVPTEEMLSAVRGLARTEGLLVDPVYGGKAFAGLLFDIELGLYPPGTNLLYIMTGGTPGLFAYRNAFDKTSGSSSKAHLKTTEHHQ